MCLCKDSEESIKHIFINCSFTSKVWESTLSLLDIRIPWHGDSCEAAWQNWWSETPDDNKKCILLIMFWGLWLARNKDIFRETVSSPTLIAAECVSIISMLPSNDTPLSIRNINTEQINRDIPWAYFDRASDAQNRCDSRLVIHINDNKNLKASVGIGSCTNNFAELLSLKLLCWLIQLGIVSVQIFGDSMSVINWFNKSQRCQNHVLIPIIEEILLLKMSFDILTV